MSQINKDAAQTPIYHSIRQTAKITGLSECFIRKLCKENKVPGYRVGNKFMIDVPSFLEYLRTSSEGDGKNG